MLCGSNLADWRALDRGSYGGKEAFDTKGWLEVMTLTLLCSLLDRRLVVGEILFEFLL